MLYNKELKYEKLIGTKINFLKIIGFGNQEGYKERRFICLCDCGEKQEYSFQRLRKGEIKSCGCLKWPDLTGSKFGQLQVVNLVEEIKAFSGRGRVWNCLCECGRYINVSTCNLKKHKTCGQFGCRGYEDRHAFLLDGLYKHTIVQRSKKIGKEFDIDFESFKSLIFSDCYYCNGLPNKSNTLRETPSFRKNNKDTVILHNGIDRIDNNVGYTKSNCVACCKICNIMKLDMSKEEFLSQVNKIHSANLLKENKDGDYII